STLLPLAAPAPAVSPPLPLHDALPISPRPWASPGSPCDSPPPSARRATRRGIRRTCPRQYSRSSAPTSTDSPGRRCHSCSRPSRSEEHTSELQSRENLVCRLLLEKKNA